MQKILRIESWVPVFIYFLLALLSACSPSPVPQDDPVALRRQAKELYREIINLRFEQPDAALLLADSILRMSARDGIDTFALVALVQKSLILSEKREMQTAVELAQKALTDWRSSDGVFAKCKALEQMGQCYYVLNRFEEARACFEQELALAPQCGEKAGGIESFAASYLGDVADKQGRWEESIRFHERAVESALKFGGNEVAGGAYHSMAAVFHTIGDYQRELDCLRKSAAYFDESDYRKAASFLNLAEAFSTLKMTDSANVYIKKAYELEGMPPVIRLVAMVGYGGTLTEQQQYEAARQLMYQAIGMADTLGDRERIGIALNQISETYAAEKKYTMALQYSMQADSVLRDSQSAANYQSRYEAVRNIIKSQLQVDGRHMAVNKLEEMDDYRDSISRAAYLEVMGKYQNKIKSDSIQLLASDNRLQAAQLKISNLLLFLLGAGILLLGVLAWFWRRNLRLSRENLDILDEQNQKLQENNQQLRQTLAQIRTAGQQDQSNMLDASIVLPTRNNLSLKLREIQYLQAFGGGVYYVTEHKKHLVWHGFEESMEMLPGEYFIKTHRSFIVNKIHVEQVSARKVFLKNGDTIPVGITMKQDVLQRLTE